MAKQRGSRQRGRGGRNQRGAGGAHGGAMQRWLFEAVSATWAADQPADVALQELFAVHRQIGARDRRRIANRCFTILRHRASLRYALDQAGADCDNVEQIVTLADARFEPAAAAAGAAVPGWLSAALAVDLSTAPLPVRLELPDWILQDLAQHLDGDGLAALAASLMQPAHLDLRVNLGLQRREQVREALHNDNIECMSEQAGALWPASLLRIASGTGVQQSSPFQTGHCEIQDAGSQFLARLAAPRRQQTVVDFCAGAGGKSLAMSDLMRNTGSIFAIDTAARRLARLAPRAKRAGASNIRPMVVNSERDPRLGRLAGRADLVFVDAPCTGTGTLRRNPDRKWRVQSSEVVAMRAAQRRILDAAVGLLRPGGRLMYATCSLLTAENEAVALAFEAAHPALSRLNLAWPDASDAGLRPAAISGAHGFIRIWPHMDQCDGYFAAAWRMTNAANVV